MGEEIEAKVEKMQEISLSYRIYLLSRRDFYSGVLIGVLSSLVISYITQMDALINDNLSLIGVAIRFVVSTTVLGYFINSHRERTKRYDVLVKKMSERVQKLQEELDEKN